MTAPATPAEAMREAAEWLETKPDIKVRGCRAKAIDWCCDYIASRLRMRADELDRL